PDPSLAVLVVAFPPDPRLITSFGCAIEPLVCAPEIVQSARIRRIGVVDDAILEHKGTHTRSLTNVRRRIRSAHSCERRSPIWCRARELGGFPSSRPHWRLVTVVVFNAFLALLFLCEPYAEIK